MKSGSDLFTGLRGQAGSGAVVGIAVVGVCVVAGAWAVVMALPLVFPPAERSAPGDSPVMLASQRDELLRKADAGVKLARDRVAARSPFYPKIVEAPPPPPAPLTYGGPSLIAILGDEAWFSTSDRLRLKPGDAEVNGLAVVSLDPPWSATVMWRGGQFTLELFKRDAFKPDSALDWLNSASGVLGPSERGAGGAAPGAPATTDDTTHVAPVPIPVTEPSPKPAVATPGPGRRTFPGGAGSGGGRRTTPGMNGTGGGGGTGGGNRPARPAAPAGRDGVS